MLTISIATQVNLHNTANTNGDACEKCPPGTYAPAGSVGACALFRCSPGWTDHDYSAATPCRQCDSVAEAPFEGHAGPCGNATANSLECANGAEPVPSPLVTGNVRSCTDLWLLGIRTNGVYAITPADGAASVDVYCDFAADSAQAGMAGGAWTLVSSSSGVPPSDSANASVATLNSLQPGQPMVGVYDGLKPLVETLGGHTDVRFTCVNASAPNANENVVDLVFADVDWVRALHGYLSCHVSPHAPCMCCCAALPTHSTRDSQLAVTPTATCGLRPQLISAASHIAPTC